VSKDHPDDKESITIEEIGEPEQIDAEALQATRGGAIRLEIGRPTIDLAQRVKVGSFAFDISRIRPGVAMLQSGHTQVPDSVAIPSFRF
jgi:hypothetical protein